MPRRMDKQGTRNQLELRLVMGILLKFPNGERSVLPPRCINKLSHHRPLLSPSTSSYSSSAAPPPPALLALTFQLSSNE